MCIPVVGAGDDDDDDDWAPDAIKQIKDIQNKNTISRILTGSSSG